MVSFCECELKEFVIFFVLTLLDWLLYIINIETTNRLSIRNGNGVGHLFFASTGMLEAQSVTVENDFLT